MIWDKHDAAWRARLTAAADYHRAHGHLAAPATTPVGAWLANNATSPPARARTTSCADAFRAGCASSCWAAPRLLSVPRRRISGWPLN
nr:helicase associated domain-containing protein [Streptomyces brasiliscabiei]